MSRSLLHRNINPILTKRWEPTMTDALLTAERLATQLFEMEDAIDSAIAKAAAFAGAMPGARKEIGASAALGHGALQAAIQTLSMLADARTAALASHGALASTQKSLGLEAVNFGGFVDKPDRKFAAHRHLQVAAASRAA